MNITGHKKALGVFYIVFGIFNILFVIFSYFLMWRIFEFAQISPEVHQIVIIAGTAVGIVMLAAAILSIIGGSAIIRLKNWSKVLLLVLGVFYLFVFPVGTVLGIYTMVVFLSETEPQKRTFNQAS